MCETINHLLCGWCNKFVIQKNHLSGKIELFRLLFNERKGDFNGKSNKFYGTYKMDVQISYCIHTKIQKKSNIQSVQRRYQRYYQSIVSIKCVEIIEGHLMPDHIHMLVSIPPKYSISQFMGYLKGKSALTGISLLTFVTVHSYLVPVTDFADASHSKSAKSATTTVSYGIFSSENAYL